MVRSAPVVATNVGRIQEALSGNEGGVCCEKDDAEGFSKAIINFLSSGSLGGQARKNGHEWFKKWMKSMANIIREMWDLSGVNLVSKSPKMCFDTARFAFAVRALALRLIFAPFHMSLSYCPDYRFMVTPANVDEWLTSHGRILKIK